jgi:hypothetical protein
MMDPNVERTERVNNTLTGGAELLGRDGESEA